MAFSKLCVILDQKCTVAQVYQLPILLPLSPLISEIVENDH